MKSWGDRGDASASMRSHFAAGCMVLFGCQAAELPLPPASDAGPALERDAMPSPAIDARVPLPEDAGFADSGVDAGQPSPIVVATEAYAERFGRAAAWAEHYCQGAFAQEIRDVHSGWPFLDAYLQVLLLISSGRVGVDLEALARCEALAMDGVCSDDDRRCFSSDLPFYGLMHAGEPCYFSFECAGGACSGGDFACGVCLADSQRGGEGTICSSNAYCRGSYCTSGTCWDGTAGDACAGSSDCQRPLGCAEGHCRAPGRAGESCPYDADCGPGLFCYQQRVCRPLGAIGEECLYDPNCQAGLVCISLDRRCAAPVGVGETCGDRIRCTADAFCERSRCTQRHPADGACSADRDCAPDLVCVDAQCTRPSEIGTAPGAPCVSSRCDFDGAGLLCVGSGRAATCQQAFVVGIGEPCESAPPGLHYCRGGEAECAADGTGVSRCRPLSNLGEPCVDQCRALAICNGTPRICHPLPARGEPCLTYEFAAYCGPGLLCGQDGSCGPPRAVLPTCN